MTVKARDEITVAMLTDIANVARYYLVQPSTAPQPAAPTVNPAPAPWTTTEPAYVASSSLWTVDLTTFTDGTFDYSPVSKSSSYTAATQAKNAADAAAQAALGAQGTANSKTLTLTQSTYPTAAQQLSTTEWIDTAARTYAWTGAAGNSFSTESVNGAVIRTNLIKDPTFEATKNTDGVRNGTVSNDSSWSVSGSNSLLLTPTGAASDVYFQFGSNDLIALPLKPGHTYTFSATIRVKAASSTSAENNGAHNINIWWHVSGGNYANAGSPSVPNTTGAVGRVSVTATIPANVDQVFVRCYHGYADGVTQFDALLIEEGSTLGSYFDGWTTSTPANTRKHWDGLRWDPIVDGTASQALTVANIAQAAAAGLVSASIAAPTSPPTGAIWFPLDANGRVIGMKLWNGTAWTSYTIMADQLLVPGSVGTVSIADGVVTAPKLSAGVLDVGNLTATGTATLAQAVAQAIWAGIVNAQVANIQDLHATTGAIDSAVIGKLAAQIITSSQFWTSLTGARIGMDAQGLHAYNSGGDKTFDLTGDTGLIRGAAIEGGSVSMIGDGSTAATTVWSDNFSSVTQTPYSDAVGRTASLIPGAGGMRTDEYNGWSASAVSQTGSISINPAATGRSGGALSFTFSGLSSSSSIYLEWNGYPGVPGRLPTDGVKLVSFWIKSTRAITLDRGESPQDPSDAISVPANTWTKYSITIPDGSTSHKIPFNSLAPDASGDTTITLDDMTVVQQTNTASSAEINKDASGRAQISLWDAEGNRTVLLNGISNRIAGDLISGNAHLTSWSDGHGNTRSGILLDDAAGVAGNEDGYLSQPRIMSNKTASGQVDTFISTPVGGGGGQGLVQVSQSMQKASMVFSDAKGYQSSVYVNTTASGAWGNSATGSSGMQWGNGYIDLLGGLGRGLPGTAFTYGAYLIGHMNAGDTGRVTVNLPARSQGKYFPLVCGARNADSGGDIVTTLCQWDASKIVVQVTPSGVADGVRLMWLAIAGDATTSTY